MNFRETRRAALVIAITILCSTAQSAPKADNTAVNKRDRSALELTADQQKVNESDTEITRQIREDIMKDKTLSVYAQNVKVISINGRVTVKGPVHSKTEANRILGTARSVAGRTNVTNELEVVKNN